MTWRGCAASDRDIDLAVAAAERALDVWEGTSVAERIGLVRAFGGCLTEHKESMAETISRDTGKPLWESQMEVGAMIGKVELSISAYEERRSEVRRDIGGTVGVTRFKPHGVCAVYGPFNLPGHLPNGHIVPALLAGNTVVFKPSEQAASVGRAMLELWDTVGLPEGVLNMVQGSRDTGIVLSHHVGLDGLFFTGSSSTGLALSKLFSDQPDKILALETGGNNPLIVWGVTDIRAAVYLTIQSAYITAGQRCTCARRLIVEHGRRGDELIDQLIGAISGIRVGRYTDQPEPFMGPLISDAAAQKLLQAQAALRDRGAQLLVESSVHPDCGAFLSPGLLDVTDLSDRVDEELFGPLLQIVRVSDFDDALKEANNTRYGLSSALLSDHRELYEAFYRRINAGIVNWNRQTTGASGQLPFGGIGASGNHRPSGYYAADYCSYPVASLEADRLSRPTQLTPGITL